VTGERDLLDREVIVALRQLDPGQAPGDLAERAFRRAMAEGRPPSLLERFVFAGRRAVLVGALATAAVWCGLLLRGDQAGSSPAAASADPAELAISAWTGEEIGP
jgi:hypothetical protein